MQLTPSQAATLKAFVIADPVFGVLPPTAGNADFIVTQIALDASPNFWVWNPATPVSDIYDNIIWANYTPANPDAVTEITTAYTNKSSACALKLLGIQSLLGGRDRFDASKDGQRAGLQDYSSNIPSGTAQNTRSGGWATIQLIIQRKANVLEKLLAVGTGTQAIPAKMTFTGRISVQDMLEVMGW